MFKKVIAIIFILTSTLSFADEEFCTKYLKNNTNYRLVCLNGYEYFYFARGLAKTGKRCECKKYYGIFGTETTEFKSVKDD